MFGKNGSDGVNCFVPGKALRRQTSHGSNHGLGVFRNLVFNDCMKNSMGLQVRQLDTRCTVVIFGEPNSRLFVEREPLLGVRCLVGGVAIHGTGLVVANVELTGGQNTQRFDCPG